MDAYFLFTLYTNFFLLPFPRSDPEWWLGQHEASLLFGRFKLQQTEDVRYCVPYSLEEGKEEKYKERQTDCIERQTYPVLPVPLDNEGNKENIMSTGNLYSF